MLKTTRLTDLLGTKAQGRDRVDRRSTTTSASPRQQQRHELQRRRRRVRRRRHGRAESVDLRRWHAYAHGSIEDGVSTANAGGCGDHGRRHFTAAADYHDATSSSQAGTGTIELGDLHSDVTAGGSGEVLDTASGLILTNGGESVTLDISGAETVEDLLNLINGAELGLRGRDQRRRRRHQRALATERRRLHDRRERRHDRHAARHPHLHRRRELARFNRGIGVPTSETGDDLRIVARDGTAIHRRSCRCRHRPGRHRSHQRGGQRSQCRRRRSHRARLATTGNGIELIDTSAAAGTTDVHTVEGSQAAEYLGFVPAGQTEDCQHDADVLQSEDRHTLETDSVFNTLLRFARRSRTNNDRGDRPVARATGHGYQPRELRPAEIGTRLQNLEVIEHPLEDENVQLQAALSQDIDVDLVEAISNLTARQYAFEASLRSTASLMQLSLLNFL